MPTIAFTILCKDQKNNNTTTTYQNGKIWYTDSQQAHINSHYAFYLLNWMQPKNMFQVTHLIQPAIDQQ